MRKSSLIPLEGVKWLDFSGLVDEGKRVKEERMD